MVWSRALVCLGLMLLAAPCGAQQSDLPLDDFAELERLSRLVEVHGRGSLSLDQLELPLPELRFDTDQNTAEKERAFRQAWLEAYGNLCEQVVDVGTEVCGDALKGRDREREHRRRIKPVLKQLKKLSKKEPRAAQAMAVLQAVLPTYQHVLEAPRGDEDRLFERRRTDADAFLKRYDFGPQVATATRRGTAVFEVQLPPETWALVRGELDAWSYTPLSDSDGNQVQLRDMRVEWGEQLLQGQVREALDRLRDLEFFTVRYAEVKNETPTGEFARVTGARLALGTYYVFQYKDTFVVFPAGGR